MANEDNLKPFNSDDPQSVEKARELGKLGRIKSGGARRKKQLMSRIYAECLMKRHEITGGERIE